MTGLLAFLALYAVLWLPFVGSLVRHAVVHLLMHWFHHHEKGFLIAFGVGTSLVPLVCLAAIVTGHWYAAGDAALLLLLLLKLLSGVH